MDAESFAQFLDQLRRFVRERLVPAEDEVEALDAIPGVILSEMRDMGLFGITIPEEFGGAGMNIRQSIETVRELAWALPAFRSILTMNAGMVGSALMRHGTPAQKAHWLPRLAEGAIAAFALSEPGSGSDAASLITRAERTPEGWCLNGVKRYISNAPQADLILVMARTHREPLPKNAHISSFLVHRGAPGLSIGSPDAKMGQAGSQIADVIMEDCHLPPDALLGEVEGQGFTAAMQSLDTGRLSVAAAATGYGRRILDTSVRYALDRKAFGEPIARFQLIQAMLADSEAELYAAECMLADASRRADAGEDIRMAAAATKMFATEACGRIADRVVQIHGGAGYLSEYKAERFFRDARLYRIYEGTTQIQQLVIAKALLRQYGLTL
jgi:acyl-CoA dehydrogenase